MTQAKAFRGVLLMGVLFVTLLSLCGAQKQLLTRNTMNTSATYRIKLTAGPTVLTGTLYDNASTRDFLAQLPLTLTLTDYNQTEKSSDLLSRLSTTGAPAGYDPSAGDFTYYGPWGNLALFYKDFSYLAGLVVLGSVDGSAATLSGVGRARIGDN